MESRKRAQRRHRHRYNLCNFFLVVTTAILALNSFGLVIVREGEGSSRVAVGFRFLEEAIRSSYCSIFPSESREFVYDEDFFVEELDVRIRSRRVSNKLNFVAFLGALLEREGLHAEGLDFVSFNNTVATLQGMSKQARRFTGASQQYHTNLDHIEQLELFVDKWASYSLGFEFSYYNDFHAQWYNRFGYAEFHQNVYREMLLLNKCYRVQKAANAGLEPMSTDALFENCKRESCSAATVLGLLNASKMLEAEIKLRANMDGCGYTCVAYLHMSSRVTLTHDAMLDATTTYIVELLKRLDRQSCTRQPSKDLMRWRGKVVNRPLWEHVWDDPRWTSARLRELAKSSSSFVLKPSNIVWSFWGNVVWEVLSLCGFILPLMLLWNNGCGIVCTCASVLCEAVIGLVQKTPTNSSLPAVPGVDHAVLQKKDSGKKGQHKHGKRLSKSGHRKKPTPPDEGNESNSSTPATAVAQSARTLSFWEWVKTGSFGSLQKPCPLESVRPVGIIPSSFQKQLSMSSNAELLKGVGAITHACLNVSRLLWSWLYGTAQVPACADNTSYSDVSDLHAPLIQNADAQGSDITVSCDHPSVTDVPPGDEPVQQDTSLDQDSPFTGAELLHDDTDGDVLQELCAILKAHTNTADAPCLDPQGTLGNDPPAALGHAQGRCLALNLVSTPGASSSGFPDFAADVPTVPATALPNECSELLVDSALEGIDMQAMMQTIVGLITLTEDHPPTDATAWSSSSTSAPAPGPGPLSQPPPTNFPPLLPESHDTSRNLSFFSNDPVVGAPWRQSRTSSAGTYDQQLDTLSAPVKRTALKGPPHVARECVVCLSHPQCTTLAPCGHRCLCLGCTQELMGGQWSIDRQHAPAALCPICRNEVKSYILREYVV